MASVQSTLSIVNASDAGVTAPFPIAINDFSTPANLAALTTEGSAQVVGSALQLTPNAQDQAGIAVLDTPIPTSGGIAVNFTMDSSGGTGADGISFFLLDADSIPGGAASVVAGNSGGDLGYADGLCDAGSLANGITQGFLGLGLDSFGDYSVGGTNAPGQAPNSAVLRGEGSGTTGYDYLAGSTYAAGIDGLRDVQVDVAKLSATQEQVDVYMRPSGTGSYSEVLSTVVDQALPNNFLLGFGASTGAATDQHDIDSLSVAKPVDLAFGPATVTDTTTGNVNPAMVNPGDQITCTYTVVNNGPNDAPGVTVSDVLPANMQECGWTVTDSAGSHTGTGSSIGLDVASGTTATITVSAMVNGGTTSGNGDHTVTLTPGSGYALCNPNAGSMSVDIGASGSSVSLTGANGTVTDTDLSAAQPFAQAQIVDTYTDPSTGAAPVDTLTVAIDPIAGALSLAAANPAASYDPSTGLLTATGTASQLQAILDGVAFTPTANSVAPGSSEPVSLVVTVTDTVPGATSGGGSPSATQTATVDVATATAPTSSTTPGTAADPTSTGASVDPTSTGASVDPTSTGASVDPTSYPTLAASQGLLPFAPLDATCADPSQVITVWAMLPDSLAGTYSVLGSGTVAADGHTYEVTGTAAQVTAALHTVQFTPDDRTITSLTENYKAVVVGGSPNTMLKDNGTGNATLAAGSGNDIVQAGVGNDTLYGGTDASTLLGGGGADTFVASEGAATISAGAGSALVFGGSGTLNFYNGAAASTVVGGPGNATVDGGQGSIQAYGDGAGTYYGGAAGYNTIIAGNGASTMMGGAGGNDRIYTNSAASDVIVAGAGNDTLVGTGSTGSNTVFGGAGHNLIAVGNGNSVIVAGSGQENLFTGATGNSTTFATTGNTQLAEGTGSNTFVAGTGNATVFSGISGTDLYDFDFGHTAGSVTIDDFKVGTDHVNLFGYGTGQASQALAGATITSGGSATTLTLSDNTRINFMGINAGQLGSSLTSV